LTLTEIDVCRVNLVKLEISQSQARAGFYSGRFLHGGVGYLYVNA